MPNFTVIVIPMLEDSYCYYVHPANDIQRGYFIDAAEIDKINKFRKDFGITKAVSNIISTSKDSDQSGANLELKRQNPKLVVMGGATHQIPGFTFPVNDGDAFDMFFGQIKCFSDFGGQFLYYFSAKGCSEEAGAEDEHTTRMQDEYMIVENVNRCIFTGNTVHIGGVTSKAFKGEAMLKAVDIVLALPDDTKIFCGHDYTRVNLLFGMKAEPQNELIKRGWEYYTGVLLKKGEYSVPSRVKDEKKYNVFMRCRDEVLRKALNYEYYPEKAMEALRQWKLTGAKPEWI